MQRQPRGQVRRNVTGRWQRHPLWKMRPRAIGLSDDKEVFRAVPGSAKYLELMARTRMERIVDANQLNKLFAGSM
jgi:hypothetical protein